MILPYHSSLLILKFRLIIKQKSFRKKQTGIYFPSDLQNSVNQPAMTDFDKEFPRENVVVGLWIMEEGKVTPKLGGCCKMTNLSHTVTVDKCYFWLHCDWLLLSTAAIISNRRNKHEAELSSEHAYWLLMRPARPPFHLRGTANSLLF